MSGVRRYYLVNVLSTVLLGFWRARTEIYGYDNRRGDADANESSSRRVGVRDEQCEFDQRARGTG